ncbi:hypothetical protein C8Q76DRAFT_801699 [Earliella scabrosa]|nr:hypothetical protein C8Q76DRAFT_801699 [Earliella scabrosa]
MFQRFLPSSLFAFDIMPVIPQEVLDNVPSFLSLYPRDVANCALVCRDWVPGSRAVLFSAITLPIRADRASDRWVAFEDLLEKNPYLAVFVRALTLKADKEGSFEVKWCGEYTFEFHWLPNIRSLTLLGPWAFSSMDRILSQL